MAASSSARAERAARRAIECEERYQPRRAQLRTKWMHKSLADVALQKVQVVTDTAQRRADARADARMLRRQSEFEESEAEAVVEAEDASDEAKKQAVVACVQRRADARKLRWRAERVEAEVEAAATTSAETAETADDKWKGYTERRATMLLGNPFAARLEGVPNGMVGVPHCDSCARFVTERYSLSVQTDPHRERVHNEDPPEVSFVFTTACEHCLERKRNSREWDSVTGGKLPDWCLPELLKNWGVRDAEHYLKCVRLGQFHIFYSHWIYSSAHSTNW